MKISVGMIVFQAEETLPKNMLTHCVESMLPFVHEFIIVEGATCARPPHYWDGDSQYFANALGHSTDGTISLLRSLSKKHPKVKLVSRDGFWSGKTEMCNAYSQIATGDYVWHVDSDEFYLETDIPRIVALLKDKQPDAVHFFAQHFYGDFKHVVKDTDAEKWANVEPWRRIFRHGKNFMWKRHEPPTYVDECGRTLDQNVISREQTQVMGISLYHYSQVVRSQAQFKAKFFREPFYLHAFDAWQKDHTTPLIGATKTVEFTSIHPKIIEDNYL